MISIPSKTIREYRKFIEYSEEGCWSFKPEVLKTMRGDKLKEIIDVLILLDDESLKIEEFKFFPSGKYTITIPPGRISFHDFHKLIQYLTDEVDTVGLVEGNELVYTGYTDPKTGMVIGQTDRGEKFFISILDDTDKKLFLRINDV